MSSSDLRLSWQHDKCSVVQVFTQLDILLKLDSEAVLLEVGLIGDSCFIRGFVQILAITTYAPLGVFHKRTFSREHGQSDKLVGEQFMGLYSDINFTPPF